MLIQTGINLSTVGVCVPILPGGQAVISTIGKKKKKKGA